MENTRAIEKEGFTLVEVMISTVILATLLLVATASLSRNIQVVGQATKTTDAAVFLETVLEDISAQPYVNLLALNGNRIYDETDANDSRFATDLTVFLATVDLLQVRAVLVDLRTGREIGRVTTLRNGS